ncbi:MAG: Rrf2 family transcriptional regulator [Clostridiales bacterium]|jgi:Rrf2 family iron-sulfur cluster assembly transcriptional regulator|nr:Rrf2 family transcriptional regulator [Clostridiales bacterium]
MKISTKGRYALRIMVDLAQHHSNEYIPLKDVSERQCISEKYSEMIVGLLSKAGFLFSSRGKGGGYRLSKSADKFSVGSVLKAVEGSLAPVSCLDTPENICPRATDCVTLPMWRELERRIEDYLDGITIADLANQTNLSGTDFCI